MTDATWLDKQMGVHALIWSKTMRLLLTTIILTMLAQPVWADTSNRAIQISPVPAIYVGGVGLYAPQKRTKTNRERAWFNSIDDITALSKL